jgi:hypothetical protein
LISLVGEVGELLLGLNASRLHPYVPGCFGLGTGQCTRLAQRKDELLASCAVRFGSLGSLGDQRACELFLARGRALSFCFAARCGLGRDCCLGLQGGLRLP